MPLTLEIPLDSAAVAAFQWVAAQQSQRPEHIVAALIQAYVQQYRRDQLAGNTTPPEPLVNLSKAELRALAVGGLTTAQQDRIIMLLADPPQQPLPPAEAAEIDELLARFDAMNTLQARAEYTLQQLAPEP